MSKKIKLFGVFILRLVLMAFSFFLGVVVGIIQMLAGLAEKVIGLIAVFLSLGMLATFFQKDWKLFFQGFLLLVITMLFYGLALKVKEDDNFLSGLLYPLFGKLNNLQAKIMMSED